MLQEGIADLVKLTRLAPPDVASVAGLLLTTEVMIAEAPKEDDHAHGGGAPAAWVHGHASSRKARFCSALNVE